VTVIHEVQGNDYKQIAFDWGDPVIVKATPNSNIYKPVVEIDGRTARVEKFKFINRQPRSIIVRFIQKSAKELEFERWQKAMSQRTMNVLG
jgi:hypothetical protein